MARVAHLVPFYDATILRWRADWHVWSLMNSSDVCARALAQTANTMDSSIRRSIDQSIGRAHSATPRRCDDDAQTIQIEHIAHSANMGNATSNEYINGRTTTHEPHSRKKSTIVMRAHTLIKWQVNDKEGWFGCCHRISVAARNLFGVPLCPSLTLLSLSPIWFNLTYCSLRGLAVFIRC